MYLFDFFKRLFKKNNIGTIIYLCMNMVMYIALLGGFALPQMIPMAILLYLICLCIALSPVGEFILRMQCGCRKIKKDKYKNRLEPLFNEAYRRAKQLDPTISDNVKLFMSKSMAPNAFAVGRKTICVTRGLCELDDVQILGILGHEFGHIANKDTDMLLVINVSNFLLTAVFFIVRVIISFIIILVGGDERPVGSILASFFIDLLLVWLMSLWTKLGYLFHMKSSRMNEYRADAFSCECGFSQNLYNALYELERSYGREEEKSVFAALGASHPETADRLDAIEEWTPGSLKIEEETDQSKLGEQLMGLKNKVASQGGEILQNAKNKVGDVKHQHQMKSETKVQPTYAGAGQLAPPPPPPIPAGMRPIIQTETQSMTPPPPLPPMSPIHPIQAGEIAPTPPPTFHATTGRVTKSLSEIVAEKEKEEAEAIKQDDFCYARYSRDGLYYYGQVQNISEQDVDFVFFDGVRQQVPITKLFKADKACEEMQCFGNWNNEGGYYPAHIIEKNQDTLTIQYDEEQEIIETVTLAQVRFALW